MNGPKIIVDKSTVPVGTAAKVTATIKEHTQFEFEVVSNPEFLKEGAAIDDFLKPDRVVVGVSSEKAAAVMRKLYAPFVRTNKPIHIMDVASAEMTKYAANTMLATRVSFMNEVALLCERVGADVNDVRIGIGSDSRIGMPFLFPGIGYGGSCFPKDVQAFIKTGREHGVDLKIAQAVEAVNVRQKMVVVQKIKGFYGENLTGKTFAIWGLAFKPKTDDVREAPAEIVCRALVEAGASLALYDPEAMQTFKQLFGEHPQVHYALDEYEALRGADALLVCTEWRMFRQPDFDRMQTLLKTPTIFDGRNIFDPVEIADRGFAYSPIGRRSVGM
jgi:UDPglucose 6-dehydrogenase